MPKLGLCAPVLSQILDRVLGELEKNSFIACQAKGDMAASCSKTAWVCSPGVFDEEFKGGGCHKIRVCGGPGLRWSGLLILISFSGPFNLASSSFLTAPL